MRAGGPRGRGRVVWSRRVADVIQREVKAWTVSQQCDRRRMSKWGMDFGSGLVDSGLLLWRRVGGLGCAVNVGPRLQVHITKESFILIKKKGQDD